MALSGSGMKNGVGLALVVGALMAVIGFFVGRRSVDAGDGASGTVMRGEAGASLIASKLRRRSSGNMAMDRLKGTDGRPASPEAAIRAVMRRLEGSPMIGMDYDAMFEAYAAIREMNPAQIRAALAELKAGDGNEQSRMMVQMLLVNQWAKKEGRAAMDYVLENSNARMRSVGVMGGVMAWMREEPEDAYAWYEENKDSLVGGIFGGGDHIQGMMIASMGQRDMAAAFEKIAGLGNEARGTALVTMAAQVAMFPDRREEFLVRLDDLEDQSLRRHALEGMVSSWAWQDPEGAAEYVGNSDLDETLRAGMQQSVAANWSQVDPESAIAWTMENMEALERDHVLGQAFSQWIGQDPESAEKWLEGQPDDVRTDRIYSQASNQLASGRKFQKAIEYIDRIEDEDVRIESMQVLLMNWESSDPEGARQWMDGLDAPIREKIGSQAGGDFGAANGGGIPVPHEIHMPDTPPEATGRTGGDAPVEEE